MAEIGCRKNRQNYAPIVTGTSIEVKNANNTSGYIDFWENINDGDNKSQLISQPLEGDIIVKLPYFSSNIIGSPMPKNETLSFCSESRTLNSDGTFVEPVPDTIFKHDGTDFSINNNVGNITMILKDSSVNNLVEIKSSDSNLNIFSVDGLGNIDAKGIIIPNDSNIGSSSDPDAISISSLGVVSISSTTDSSSSTTGALKVVGGCSISKSVNNGLDLIIGGDLNLISDQSKLKFGTSSNLATLTHVANGVNSALKLNESRQLQFYNGNQFIRGKSDAILQINATDEIELNATLIDINGNINASGSIIFGSMVKNDITITGFVDEDDMNSNSASLIPTQQSVKAYIDTKHTKVTQNKSQTIAAGASGDTISLVNYNHLRIWGESTVHHNFFIAFSDTENGTYTNTIDLPVVVVDNKKIFNAVIDNSPNFIKLYNSSNSEIELTMVLELTY